MNVILKSEILKTVLKGLHILVEEARFRFDEEGMHVRAVDPANVAMVIANVPKDSFEAYKINKDEELIGVDVNRVYDFIKSAKKDELIDLWTEDESLVVKNGNTKYSSSLIDPSAIKKEPKIPSLELPAEIVFDAGEFKKAVQVCEKIDDRLTFNSSKEEFSIEAEGDVDKITFSLDGSELKDFNRAKAKSMFSIEYMKEVAKVAQNGNELTVKLGTNYPVWLIFDIDEKATVEYIVAPRIEVEE
jgi:proliferating cell nuclear antigen